MWWFRCVCAGMLLTGALTSSGRSQPVAWMAHPDGRVHWYEVIEANPWTTWGSARDAAQLRTYQGSPGHLVTITSPAENVFISANLVQSPDLYWIGGYQPSGSPEPAGGWRWITGEPWSFTNWSPGEPSNHHLAPQGEDALTLWGTDAPSWSAEVGKWNDFPSTLTKPRMIVEYDVPKPSRPPQLHALLVNGSTDGWRKGDIDVSRIQAALSQFTPVPSANIVPLSLDGPQKMSSLEKAMTELVGRVQPGDRLLFYFVGHGAILPDGGNEPPVSLDTGVFGWLLTQGVFKDEQTGDEYLALGSDEGQPVKYSDNQLTKALSSRPELADVAKLIILDSCFSGGFIGRPGNETDEGDLDKLTNYGLIASTNEGSFGYGNLLTGRGHMSVALENALLDLAASNDQGFTFAELQEGMEEYYQAWNFSYPWAVSGEPSLDPPILIQEGGTLSLVTQFSPDFDANANFAVPEPAALSLLALGGLGLIRRRRPTWPGPTVSFRQS